MRETLNKCMGGVGIMTHKAPGEQKPLKAITHHNELPGRILPCQPLYRHQLINPHMFPGEVKYLSHYLQEMFLGDWRKEA